MSAPPETAQTLLARQPIFDRNLKVAAYELLYRNDEAVEAVFLNGEQATSEVLLNNYTSIYDRGRAKQVPAFINMTRDMLLKQSIPAHLKQQVVLEILEDVEVDDALVSAVKKLKAEGFQLALDDFIFNEQFRPLLELVDIVKVDILPLDRAQLEEQVSFLKPFGVTLLAEKIEDVEQMEHCIELGFALFQGFFLSRPQLVKGQKISSNSTSMLKLAQKLESPDITIGQIEALVIQDPALTFKLLRVVNSAAFSLVNKVESLSQAIVMLGVAQIKKWVLLIALGGNDAKPEELTRALLIRARMCELLAQATRCDNANSYFMVGLMSEINVLLYIELDVLLEQIPLHQDIKQAITHYSGNMGKVLQVTIAYERAQWERLGDYGFDEILLEEAYFNSVRWTEEAMKALHSPV